MRIVRQGTRLTLELQGGCLDLTSRIWPEVFKHVRENLPVEVVLDVHALAQVDDAAFGRLRDVIAALCRYVPSVVLKGGTAVGRLLDLRGAGSGSEAPAEGGASAPPLDTRIPQAASGADAPEDMFIVDLDMERLCLPNEPAQAETEAFSKVEFTREGGPVLVATMPDAAISGAAEILREPLPVRNSGAETPPPFEMDFKALCALLAPVKPEAPPPDEAPASAQAAPAIEEMPAAAPPSVPPAGEAEDRAGAAERTAACGARRPASPDAAIEALRRGDEAWEMLRPRLAALARGFRSAHRLAPEALGPALSALARCAEAAPLAAYGPVFPPSGDEARLCAAAGMSAAVGASIGFRGAELEDVILAALLAVLLDIDTAAPERREECVAACEAVARGLRPADGPAGGAIERALAWTRPARTFARLIAEERREMPEAIDALVTREQGEELRAFLAVLGTHPRGAWLRLTDGTIAQAVAPLEDGLMAVRLFAEGASGLAPAPPAPLRAGRNERCDVAGFVRAPAVCGRA